MFGDVSASVRKAPRWFRIQALCWESTASVTDLLASATDLPASVTDLPATASVPDLPASAGKAALVGLETDRECLTELGRVENNFV